jgi:hypothetical protein
MLSDRASLIADGGRRVDVAAEKRRDCRRLDRLSGAEPVECAVRKEAAKTSASGDVSELRSCASAKPAADRLLPHPRQLLLILHLRLDLDAARFDAFLQRQRQAQHPVSMRSGQFLEVEELRNH